jgi:valyl-tRNA synthetase
MVLDPLGKKMSKSKNNVVSPIEIADQYGADAARMALVFGTATGHDQSLSYSKLDAMRKFTNKLWNIGRFIIDFKPEDYTPSPNSPADMSGMIKQFKHADDQKILQDLNQTIKQVSSAIESYRFHDGAESIYEFIWHNFADKYIESTKERRQEAQPVLEYVLRVSLELLHPYMPFITEEIWSRLPKSSQDMKKASSIMITHWPIAQ